MVCIQLLSFSVYLPLKYYSPTVLQKCWYAGPGQDFNLQNWTVNSSQAVMTMWLEQLSFFFCVWQFKCQVKVCWALLGQDAEFDISSGCWYFWHLVSCFVVSSQYLPKILRKKKQKQLYKRRFSTNDCWETQELRVIPREDQRPQINHTCI